MPHFLGLHALQVLPLFALGLRRTRQSEAQRSRLVVVAAASYAALVALLLWQALRGQPLVAPDRQMLLALLVWLVASLAAGWRALARGPAQGAPAALTPCRENGQ